MKFLFSIIFFGGTALFAQVPEKAPIQRYSALWTDSPFTSKPPPVSSQVAENPFEDLTLIGFAPVPGGHRITLMSKKNPGDKVVINPGEKSDFTVISVHSNSSRTLGTIVKLKKASFEGTVTFEKDQLDIAAIQSVAPAPEANATMPQPSSNPNVQTVRPPQISPDMLRQPRRRVVPPPTDAPGGIPNQ